MDGSNSNSSSAKRRRTPPPPSPLSFTKECRLPSFILVQSHRPLVYSKLLTGEPRGTPQQGRDSSAPAQGQQPDPPPRGTRVQESRGCRGSRAQARPRSCRARRQTGEAVGADARHGKGGVSRPVGLDNGPPVGSADGTQQRRVVASATLRLLVLSLLNPPAAVVLRNSSSEYRSPLSDQPRAFRAAAWPAQSKATR